MNIFLTGEKNIGKSTILNRVLAFANPSYAGFRSTITKSVHQNIASCHMMPVYQAKGGKPIEPLPSIDNELFTCHPEGKLAPSHLLSLEPSESASIITDRFNTLGSNIIDTILMRKDEVQLIIMDELGPGEKDAEQFIEGVTKCLDFDTPVLGILQKCDADYISRIKERSDTRVYEVTKNNRENLHIVIISLLQLWSNIV